MFIVYKMHQFILLTNRPIKFNSFIQEKIFGAVKEQTFLILSHRFILTMPDNWYCVILVSSYSIFLRRIQSWESSNLISLAPRSGVPPIPPSSIEVEIFSFTYRKPGY